MAAKGHFRFRGEIANPPGGIVFTAACRKDSFGKADAGRIRLHLFRVRQITVIQGHARRIATLILVGES